VLHYNVVFVLSVSPPLSLFFLLLLQTSYSTFTTKIKCFLTNVLTTRWPSRSTKKLTSPLADRHNHTIMLNRQIYLKYRRGETRIHGEGVKGEREHTTQGNNVVKWSRNNTSFSRQFTYISHVDTQEACHCQPRRHPPANINHATVKRPWMNEWKEG